MPFKNYRQESRSQWGTETSGNITLDQVKAGAILRIADASEVMAKNFLDLQGEIQSLRESRDSYQKMWLRAERRISALKGALTRAKKRVVTGPAPNEASEALQ